MQGYRHCTCRQFNYNAEDVGYGGESKRKCIYWLLLNHKALLHTIPITRLFTLGGRELQAIFYFCSLFLNFCIYYTKFLMPCQEISYVLLKIISRKVVGCYRTPHADGPGLSGQPTFGNQLC